jgi:ABC-type uncharacterized transport system substrate-binding protein
MRRRAFISLLGGAAAWPLAARGQQGERMRRICVLMVLPENDPQSHARVAVLQQGLDKLGWTVGRNLAIDYRWGVSDVERARATASELLNLAPDLILANAISAVRGAQLATRTVPIVFTGVSEPVTQGIVASLARPGRNITGFANFENSIGGKWLELLKEIAPAAKRTGFIFNPDAAPNVGFFHAAESAAPPLAIGLAAIAVRDANDIKGFSSRAAELEAKRLQLLKEVVPGLSRVALLFNPTNHYMPLALQSARKGAQMLRVSLGIYKVHDTTTLDAAFVTLTKDRPDAFMVPADTFLVSQRSRIAQFAIENKLPSVYSFREYIEAGGLLAYTPNYDDLFRRAASYVDKILKGTKPGELPIEQPTRFHLLINLKTARALGLTMPPTLLARADEVIE